jgi:hypothetical protein
VYPIRFFTSKKKNDESFKMGRAYFVHQRRGLRRKLLPDSKASQ